MLGVVTFCLILLALGVATWFRPAVGLAAVLCLYGIKQWGMSTTPFFYEHNQVANYSAFIIASIGLARAAARRGCILCRIPATTQLVVALLGYALISLLWTPDITVALQQWGAQGPYILTIAMLAPLLMTDFEDVRIAFTSTALAGAVLSLLALIFGKWGARGLLLYGDIHDWEANPLALSSMAGTVFIISALSLGRPNRIWWRLIAMACIPIALAVVLRSGSRGQLIASVAAVIVAIPIAFRMKDPRSIAGLLIAAAIIVGLGSWGASLVEIDTSRWTGADAGSAVTGRLDNARQLLDAATSSPLTIVFGLGNSSSFPLVGFYTHIAALEVVAEEGLIGMALYLALLPLMIRSLLRILRQPDLSDSRRNALAMLVGLLIFELILTQKQGSLLSSVYVFLYAIILARLEEPIGRREVAASELTIAHAAQPRFQNLLR